MNAYLKSLGYTRCTSYCMEMCDGGCMSEPTSEKRVEDLAWQAFIIGKNAPSDEPALVAIEDAIRKAIAEEREACAKLAANGGPDAPWNGRDREELENLALCARRIAAAIRARA